MNTTTAQNLIPGDRITIYGNEHTIAKVHVKGGFLELEYTDNPMLRDVKYPHSTIALAN